MIDILTLSRGRCPSFVVNNAVEYVPLIRAGIAGLLGTYDNNTEFVEGDNFTILSVGYKLPLGFELVGVSGFPDSNSEFLGVTLRTQVGVGISSAIYPRVIPVPFDNYELSLNTFVDKPSKVIPTSKFHILWDYTGGTIGDFDPVVSMLNVPSALNGKTFYLTPFVKIEHTFELQPEEPT